MMTSLGLFTNETNNNGNSMSVILGINETSHDASVSLIKDGEILFAGHAERYSKQKNDWYVNNSLIQDALSYGTPDH